MRPTEASSAESPAAAKAGSSAVAPAPIAPTTGLWRSGFPHGLVTVTALTSAPAATSARPAATTGSRAAASSCGESTPNPYIRAYVTLVCSPKATVDSGVGDLYSPFSSRTPSPSGAAPSSSSQATRSRLGAPMPAASGAGRDQTTGGLRA